MIRELRDLWFTVYRCSEAIEMPDVVKARDELIHRFVSAAISDPAVAASPTPDLWTGSDGADELPLYCEPDEPLRRAVGAGEAGQRIWTRRSAISRDEVPTRRS